MKAIFLLLFLLCLASSNACAQTSRPDLYNCEGCEAIYEHAFDNLSWQTVIPDKDEPGEWITISGRVYQPDGKTPAPDVILYVYHTNAQGVYPKRGDETGWARRHGYLRGWMTTNEAGHYQFETIRPAPYPKRRTPAHIHIVVKEPNRREYWIDSFHFEGDPFLTPADRAGDNRGGSGIITLVRDEQGVWQGERDIILER